MSAVDSIFHFLFWALAVSTPLWLIGFVTRRLSEWLGSRAAARALAVALSTDSPKSRLMPESTFVVEITDTGVTCHRPDGQTETVLWDDLQKVEILTTSDGPLVPNTFWLLHGRSGGCVIPFGAAGDTELLVRLQSLPAFDNQAIIEPRGNRRDALVTCWTKPQPHMS